MKIKRTIANEIMTRAIRNHETCLLCLLWQGENLHCLEAGDDIPASLQQKPEAILVYNQNPESLRLKEDVEYQDGQQLIEVFQDTEGVFGLRAWRLHGKLQQPVVLEFSDD